MQHPNGPQYTEKCSVKIVDDLKLLILFRMGGGGGKKAQPTSFSPVTSTHVGIRPQNFLTFSFNPFDRLV